MARCRAGRDASRRAAGVSSDRGSRAQERIEGELRASEAKFSGILAIAADAIITIDHSQRIVHFNNGAEEMFGYKASDAIGRHLSILLPPRFRAGPRRAHRIVRAVAGDGAADGRAPRDLRAPRRRHGVSRGSIDLEARHSGRPPVHRRAARHYAYRSAPKRTSDFSAARRANWRIRSPSTRPSAPSSICRFRGSPTRRCSTSWIRRALRGSSVHACRQHAPAGRADARRSTRWRRTASRRTLRHRSST